LAQTKERQDTRIPGLFVAGDADGEVQFAIVAGGEGAIAATAINKALQEDDQKAQN
jgi:thioredoxin reductase